jgi:hypothetical protein
MSVNIVLSIFMSADGTEFHRVNGFDQRVTSLMLFDHRLVARLARPPKSLHDAECKMRDPCALDHLGALQLDRFRGLVEQSDAVPE